MPGCLIPGDLERIQELVGDHSGDFVMEHFVVSSGARVLKRVRGVDYVFNIPSLVPAQRPDGRCVFLDEQDRCKIHSVSPFGCSHCDTHLSRAEGDRRMQFCINSQIDDHVHNGAYSQWCAILDAAALRATPIEVRRTAMEKLIDES